ncbi:hypothetical protein BZG02_15945 [Labilibaculum filiforme]|uniref:Uncharacterized protein n=1 Tax=Labilibaculum filiforme TaxID=1940526 RepID=A0A2N3HTP7_9BACT|nr:hypothetical protein BZG02_15945 [Labilibaculum filiforme]
MIFIAFQHPIKNLNFSCQAPIFTVIFSLLIFNYFCCKKLTDRFPTDCCFFLEIYRSDFLNFVPNFLSSIDF